MVGNQLIPRGINNPHVLEAMRKVERHRFVPKDLEAAAYSDRPLPIGHGQTISQPYIVALMSQLCDLRGGEKVLEIGTGSGYQAAVLAEIASLVYTVESVPSLAKKAQKILDELGYTNIRYTVGDGHKGLPEHAPYDVIILTAAPAELPDALPRQLADNGIIVAPIGRAFQELYTFRKSFGRLEEKMICPVAFVPMVKD